MLLLWFFPLYIARPKDVVMKVNSDYNVAELCDELPEWVHALYDAEGGKLGK